MVNQNAPQLMGYGYVSDSDESLQTKSGGNFGGNFGNARLMRFAYNSNTAKEGQPVQEAIEIVVKIVDREYKAWLSPISKVFDNNNTEITDRTSPEFVSGYNALITQQGAVALHYLKSVGVQEEAIKNLLSMHPATSFADYAAKICSLLPADYPNKPIDYFLEYQWNVGKKADGSLHDITFLTVPGNMKGGYFVVPAQQGPWTEKRADDGSLTYVNPQGQKHPFDRNANYMSSKKAIQQGGNTPALSSPGAPTTDFAPANGAAKTTTWNVPQQ